jgi:hypothetical protein
MLTVENTKQPVQQFYYTQEEWARLGCGPLPAERHRARQLERVMVRGNPVQDGKNVKGYN